MSENCGDEKLVDMFFSRNEDAILLTQERYGAVLHGIADGILGNGADSEECVNDALLAVWDHIPPDRPNCFKAYICKILRNVSLMRYREKRSKKRFESEFSLCMDELQNELESALTTEKEFENGELARLINRFIGGLNDKRRYMFVSRYCLSSPIKEIAGELRCSESLVFHDLSAMKKELKEMLIKEGF